MPGDPFYCSKAWRALRALVLAQEPHCRMCARVGVVRPAVDVDHIVRRRDCPALAFTRSNVQPLCQHCHRSIKQSHECRGSNLGHGLDGRPRGPHPWNRLPEGR